MKLTDEPSRKKKVLPVSNQMSSSFAVVEIYHYLVGKFVEENESFVVVVAVFKEHRSYYYFMQIQFCMTS